MVAPEKKILVESYRRMVRIRRVEEKLMEVFSLGEIPGFIHVCIGQEATPVAVASHLNNSDYIATTHRGHGHALAKGIDLKLFMAELFGKKNGPCRGRSGSMHLADRSMGILGANGIVAGGIPIAVGAAFASLYKKTEQVTVCFF
jgi:TPP-dependent pyruvate/acetoin dehydrogenase alpha subunit